MKAKFVSVWDDGIEVRSNCDYDPETRIVTNIESVDVQNVDILKLLLYSFNREYVELPDGTEIENFINPDNE